MPNDLESWKKLWGIGLTGGIASGKSTVAKYLAAAGFVVVDADLLSRQAIAQGTQGYEEVLASFGSQLLDAEGNIDRAALRQLVSQDRQKLAQLEAIVHKYMPELLRQDLAAHQIPSRPQFWFYEASLLIELQLQQQFFEVWLCVSGKELQLQRLKTRNLGPGVAAALLSRQWDDAQKQPHAQVLIENRGSLAELHQKLDHEIDRLRKLEDERKKRP